jgi:hypothetical protein
VCNFSVPDLIEIRSADSDRKKAHERWQLQSHNAFRATDGGAVNSAIAAEVPNLSASHASSIDSDLLPRRVKTGRVRYCEQEISCVTKLEKLCSNGKEQNQIDIEGALNYSGLICVFHRASGKTGPSRFRINDFTQEEARGSQAQN